MTSPLMEFQEAVRLHLLGLASVTEFVADRVWDGPASGDVTYPNITFGPITALDDDVDCIGSLDVSLQIDVWSQYQAGKLEAMELVDVVKRALHHAELELPVNGLVDLEVEFSQVIGDPDNITSHGIIRVGAILEEL